MGPEQSVGGSGSTEAATLDGHDDGGASASKSCSDQPTCGAIAGLLAGLVAGGILWGLLWQFDPDVPDRQYFSIPTELAGKMAEQALPGPELAAEYGQAISKVALAHAAMFVGLFGILLGGCLGIAHGASQRSMTAAIVSAILGCVIGGLVGCLGGMAGHHAFHYLLDTVQTEPLTATILGQGAMLGVLGAGVGFGFGLGARRGLASLNSLVFGLVAGILAACVFAFSAAFLLPDAVTATTIPHEYRYLRLLWAGLIGASMGMLIPAAFGKRPSKAKSD